MLQNRDKTLEEIQELLNEIFSEKQNRFNFEYFVEVCSTVSSDIFLAIIILLQNSIPLNFSLYKNSFEELENSEGLKPSSRII